MTPNQLKMMVCLLLVAFISCGLYFYIFWKKLDHKPYYEQLAFAYGLLLGFTELLVAIILYILIKTRAQITSLGEIGRYIRQNCYKEYYALIIINLVFLVTFNIITILDPESVSFKDIQSLHFIAAYYVQSVLFAIFSNDLLKRRSLIPNEYMFEREGIFRCAYEVLYYVVCLFIVLSYFLVTHFEKMPEPNQTLCQLIIFTLLYQFYSITKLGILIKIFLIITTTRLLYSAANSIQDLKETSQKGSQITLVVITVLFLIRMVQQSILGILRAREQYLNQIQHQTPDILSALNLMPPRDPYIRGSTQIISEEQIQMMPQQKFKLENEFVCSICDMNLLKNEMVMKLSCSHIFHSECLKPWIRIKNSCPNCRQQVLRQGNHENHIQQPVYEHPQEQQHQVLHVQIEAPPSNENNQAVQEFHDRQLEIQE
ncbi:unnamed protein product (macronuclear) [Paramecium tetraurelia]|uniref:RING-type domain-containing protein n=1 Tax=Paramecium tetraurelia TaxID=5888 RepID=A0C450_PARTE|nr:uncharacterized protein GSPATT00035047001 [Paramecium tetraurelia]CAK65567.1 unnamed protein product [Paramecium tetraurelia]|eukprot:XP_001432964.1 hypothetical protein (macronuclear) [Paramecium tetraurelia strain d4-2]